MQKRKILIGTVAFSILNMNMLLTGERPNIIVILVDDMGFSDLGCYGSEINTPNIDSLAQDGVRFVQSYNTGKCFPSRSCLLTGLYAQQTGMDRRHGIMNNSVTIAEVLKTANYHTLASGKHHGEENLYHRGFDHYWGLRDGATNHFNPGNKRPNEVTPAQKKVRHWCDDAKTMFPFTPADKNFYSTDAYTNKAIQWLNEAKNSSKKQPFFLYLAYTAPHDPLMAHQKDIDKYKGKYDVGYEKIREARYQKQLELGLIDKARYPLSKATYRSWQKLTPEQRQREAKLMEVYAAMIDCVDQNVGRLITTLKANNQFDNTIIMFMSDNGASNEVVRLKNGDKSIGSVGEWNSLGKNWANVSNTPFRFFKNYSYEGGINSPFIVYWPKGIKKEFHGKVFKERAIHFIDIMPTVVELAQAQYPNDYKGKKIIATSGESLVDVLRNGDKKRSEDKILCWQWSRGKGIRIGDWKLVWSNIYKKNNAQLFNMSLNRTETADLKNQYPEKVKELEEKYNQWFEEVKLISKDANKKLKNYLKNNSK
ncbi:arylsulfatase [Lentisphaerota bacterium WC36G]|nr:arylsulfatase [Lentisphaerae bacterium WC36]